jgi:hypothetical protein
LPKSTTFLRREQCGIYKELIMTKFTTIVSFLLFTSSLFYPSCNGSDTDLYSQIPPGLNRTELASWIGQKVDPYRNDESFYQDGHKTGLFRRYHGHEITPESLPFLMPYPDPDTTQALEKYFDTAQDSLRSIANFPITGDQSKFPRVIPRDINVRTSEGVDKKFSITLASPHERQFSLTQDSFSEITEHQYAELKAHNLDRTFILPVVLGNYLLFKQWKEQHPNSPITTSEVYLFHIPGRPFEIHDGNYALVTPVIDKPLPLPPTHPKVYPKLLLNNIGDLAAVIKHCNIPKSFLIGSSRTSDFKINIGIGGYGLLPADTTPETDTTPQNFFNKNIEKYKSTVDRTLASLPYVFSDIIKELKDRENNH